VYRDDEVPFEEIARAMHPGEFDLRVLEQDQLWVDERARVHRLEEMGVAYQINVLLFCREHAPHWHGTHLLNELDGRFDEIFDLLPTSKADRDKAALAWIEHRALYRRLLTLARIGAATT